MNAEVDLVTVYRSADSDADQDAAAMQRYLVANGLGAVIFSDENPGVVQGSCEVRVPAAQVADAETLVAGYDPDAPVEVDPSPELDMVTLVSRMGATGEMEVIGIKSVLDAAEIPCVIIGDSTLPNLSFQVQVAQADVVRAQEVLAEAEAAGPAAAAAAQQESELASSADPQV